VQKRDHVASSSTQYVLPHEGITAAALMWNGHQETRSKDDVAVVKTGKCESSIQPDSDIMSEFSELLTTEVQMKVTCL